MKWNTLNIFSLVLFLFFIIIFARINNYYCICIQILYKKLTSVESTRYLLSTVSRLLKNIITKNKTKNNFACINYIYQKKN